MKNLTEKTTSNSKTIRVKKSDKRNVENSKVEDQIRGHYSKYSFDGKNYTRGRLVLAVLENFLRAHPNLSLEKINKKFNSDKLKVDSILVPLKEAKKETHYLDKDSILKVGKYKVAVTKMWRNNISDFIEISKNLGFRIREKHVPTRINAS